MKKISVLFCLALVVFLNGNSQVTVFPGDANANGACNHVDLLQIGQSYLLTGPPRNAQDIIWSAHTATPWSGQPASINAVHSDCNGDGLVDRFDALAIDNNFGQFVGGFLIPDDTSFGNPNDPGISIHLVQDSIFVQGTTVLTMSLELGDANHPVDSIYGLALTIDYDPLIVDNIILNWTGGFLADSMGNNAMLFARADTVLGKIFLAVSGIDHQNRTGYGTLGTIGIVMDDNIRISGQWSLLIEPVFALGLTANAVPVPLYPNGDTLTVMTGNQNEIASNIHVFPNPAMGRFAIRSNDAAILGITLLDMQGRNVVHLPQLNSQFEILTCDGFAPGCYLLEVHTASGTYRRKLVIQSN